MDGKQPLTMEVALQVMLRSLVMQCRFAEAADHNRDEAVRMARQFGATWQQIGDACGISRQTAHKRFADYDKD